MTDNDVESVGFDDPRQIKFVNALRRRIEELSAAFAAESDAHDKDAARIAALEEALRDVLPWTGHVPPALYERLRELVRWDDAIRTSTTASDDGRIAG